MDHFTDSLKHLEENFFDCLAQTRKDAGEPRIGCREVELVRGHPMGWVALKRLREAGKITRSRGWTWITEEAFAEWLTV